MFNLLNIYESKILNPPFKEEQTKNYPKENVVFDEDSFREFELDL